jgi:hypothetical protein
MVNAIRTWQYAYTRCTIWRFVVHLLALGLIFIRHLAGPNRLPAFVEQPDSAHKA